MVSFVDFLNFRIVLCRGISILCSYSHRSTVPSRSTGAFWSTVYISFHLVSCCFHSCFPDVVIAWRQIKSRKAKNLFILYCCSTMHFFKTNILITVRARILITSVHFFLLCVHMYATVWFSGDRRMLPGRPAMGPMQINRLVNTDCTTPRSWPTVMCWSW